MRHGLAEVHEMDARLGGNRRGVGAFEQRGRFAKGGLGAANIDDGVKRPHFVQQALHLRIGFLDRFSVERAFEDETDNRVVYRAFYKDRHWSYSFPDESTL